MTACLFKVETDAGWVVGMYPDKTSAKQYRNKFPHYGYGYTESGLLTDTKVIRYGATVCRGPTHKLGETGQTRHRLQGDYWVGRAALTPNMDQPTITERVDPATGNVVRHVDFGPVPPPTAPPSMVPRNGDHHLPDRYPLVDPDVPGLHVPVALAVTLNRHAARIRSEAAMRAMLEGRHELVVVRPGHPMHPVDANPPTRWVHPMCRSVVAPRVRPVDPVDQLADSADLSDGDRRRLHEFAERSRRRTW